MFLNFHLIKINADQNLEFMSGHSVKASFWEQNKVEMLLMSKCDLKGFDWAHGLGLPAGSYLY